jgi:hypothetical protein
MNEPDCTGWASATISRGQHNRGAPAFRQEPKTDFRSPYKSPFAPYPLPGGTSGLSKRRDLVCQRLRCIPPASRLDSPSYASIPKIRVALRWLNASPSFA